jgi:adenylyl-sulfate kinase
MTNNSTWHPHQVARVDRSKLLNQKPCIIWLTGLSASGKSSIANELEINLYKRGYLSYLLDGDNLRHGLNKDLGFSNQNRIENIRRVGEVSKLFLDAGLIVICALISPFKKDRQIVRNMVFDGDFIEVFIDTPIDICESRDPKGLYQKARTGKIPNFTGINSPYEKPESPEIHIRGYNQSVADSSLPIIQFLERNNFFL